VIPSDVGRPIGDIKPNIDIPDLEEIIARAIDTVSAQERDVRDRNGKWYSLWVRPYKNLENRIDGAVLSLLDKTDKHEAAAREFADAIVDTVRDPLMVLDESLRVEMVNRSFLELFRFNSGEVAGKRVYELGNGAWNIPRLAELLDAVLSRGERFEGFEVVHDFPGIGQRRLLLNARRIQGTEVRAAMILLAMEDVTGKGGDGDGRMANEE